MRREVETRLLRRAPLKLLVDGKIARSLFVLECGHVRNPMAGFYQHCAGCALIPHPRTNPDAYPRRGRRNR